jgi:hypothetical protein
MLEDESLKNKKTDYATATFKATRLINSHSVETLGAGVLDVRISHRFGYVNNGISNLFGLDEATNRLALEYGISNRLMVGIGRSSFQKQIDGFAKFKLLRQETNGGMPVTLSAVATSIMRTDSYSDQTRINYYSSRFAFAYQILIARKFSDSFSLQLIPEMIHYNLAETPNTNNNIYAVGIGGRIKLSKRISFNAEYHYQIPSTKWQGTYNSLAVGFDIETGGHVFQLHFTNSSGFTERNFVSETTGDFFKGDIRFGFHLSRVFTLKKNKKS